MDNLENQIYIGCHDTQTVEQKDKNYKFEEVCTAVAPVNWVEKPQASWRKFTIRDQNGSGECVAMTYATELGIVFNEKYGEWIDFSSSFPYQQRKYPDQSGCTSEDVYSIFPKIGNVFERDMPSQLMTDAQAMAVPRKGYFADLAKVYRIPRIQLPIDFDTVASTIQYTGKGVMVWFKFSVPEWTNIPQVLPQPITSGHSVTAIDCVLYQGKEYLVIQDSWGLKYAMGGLRLISREYFNARCFLSSYIMNFQTQDNSTVPQRPVFKGTVSSAKDCYKWEGVFAGNLPSNEVADNIFRSATSNFQKRYNIVPTLGNFGPITQGKLKEVYQ